MNENPQSDPVGAQPDPDAAGESHDKKQDSVRSRTVRHLRRLLAAGAVGGAAVQLPGCIVCDPLPPPISCETDLLTSTDVLRFTTARWTQSDTNDAVDVTIGGGAYTQGLTFADDPVLIGGTLVSSEFSDGGEMVWFTFLPDEGVTDINISIPVVCEDQDRVLSYTLDLSRGTSDAIRISVAE